MGWNFYRRLERQVKGNARGLNRWTNGSLPSAEKGWDFDTPDPDTVQWDPETGMPIGLKGPPNAEYAQEYQWRHNQMVQQRNLRRRTDAQSQLSQGAAMAQSFRAGGFAERANQVYSQRAQLFAQDQIEPNDLLANWRNQQEVDARNRNISKTHGALTGLVAIVGGLYSGQYGIALAGLNDILGGQSAGTTGSGNALASYASYLQMQQKGGGGAAGPTGGPTQGGQAPFGAVNAQGQVMQGPGWANGSPGLLGNPGSTNTPGSPGTPQARVSGGGDPSGGQTDAPGSQQAQFDPYALASVADYRHGDNSIYQDQEDASRTAMARRIAY